MIRQAMAFALVSLLAGASKAAAEEARRATVDEAWEVARTVEAEVPWHIETKVSAVTDTLDVSARVTSRDTIVGRNGQETRAIFVVHCRDDTTEVYFVMGGHLFFGTPVVTTRVDKQKAVAKGWSVSTNNQAAFAYSPIPFIKSLAGADRLLIKTTPGNAPGIEVVFYISGIDEVTRAVRTACAW